MKCTICGQESGANDLRMGVCWWCAETECIIEDGLDMNDLGLGGKPKAALSTLDKVRLLSQKGLLIKRL